MSYISNKNDGKRSRATDDGVRRALYGALRTLTREEYDRSIPFAVSFHLGWKDPKLAAGLLRRNGGV